MRKLIIIGFMLLVAACGTTKPAPKIPVVHNMPIVTQNSPVVPMRTIQPGYVEKMPTISIG